MKKKCKSESFAARCERLRKDAEAGDDTLSATFLTALRSALALPIPASVKEANLILVLNRKLAR